MAVIEWELDRDAVRTDAAPHHSFCTRIVKGPDRYPTASFVQNMN